MIERVKKILRGPMRNYLIVGVSVYIFELVIIIVAIKAGTSSVVAVGLSFWLGLMVSFVLQKFVTFGDKRTHHKILIPQIVAVTLLVIFNFGFTLLVTKILSPPLPAVLTRTLALGTTTIWNFYLYKTRIFKTDENPVY